MSKRHRKTKEFKGSVSHGVGFPDSMPYFDLEMYEAPRGKKPKGKHRREAHKQKYAFFE